MVFFAPREIKSVYLLDFFSAANACDGRVAHSKIASLILF